ncbi:MAG: cytochrome c oxidase assembly protein [Solirubrobacteraceae bacterium]|nr:cytochrome c oxidase assembly protein [Solirubrobacteraceae bacterium]
MFASTAAAQLGATVPVALLYLVVYAMLLRRARERPSGRRVGVGHALPFVAGVALLTAVAVPPISTGADELLSVHMVQHVVVGDLIPALLVLGLRAPILQLGLPAGVLRALAPGGRWGHVTRTLTNPWVALPIWIAAQLSWSLPAAMSATQSIPAAHVLQHAVLFYAGVLLWWTIVDPLGARRHEPRFSRLAIVGMSRGATAAVCLPLTFLPTHLFPSFEATALAHGIDPLVDQRLAGAAMCFLELLVFGIAFLVVFLNALSREERAVALRERLAGRA